MQKATIAQLIESYKRTGNVWVVAGEFGMCGQSVHERLKRAGVVKARNVDTSKVEKIEELYRIGFVRGDGKLSELGAEIGLGVTSIARIARRLGLTNSHRTTTAHLRTATGERIKALWQRQKHPRGMLGLKHTDATKLVISKSSKRAAKSFTQEKRSQITMKTLKTKVAKYGSAATKLPRGSWKASWVVIGGRRFFARSMWEANYGRYLQWLKENKQIAEWEHEPETFWFEKIKRGVRSYLPDYRVTENNGSIAYHEVKGWMCPRSKTTLRRMRIYHPKVSIRVIGKEWFRDNAKKLRGLVPEWESKAA